MISEKLLKVLYLEKDLRQKQIAKLFGLIQPQISEIFKDKRIHRRNYPEIKPKNYNKNWSEKEIKELEKLYGIFSFKQIAKKLDRSPKGVKTQIRVLGLGRATEATEYITAHQLAEALGRDTSTITNWIDKKGLPATKKVLTFKRKCYQIKVESFWKWAKEHPKLMRWEKYERNSLGKEPKWLEKELKNIEYENTGKPWGVLESLYLKEDYKNGMPLCEMSNKYKRKSATIDARLRILGVKKTRKIKIDWKAIEDKILLDLREEGKPYSYIAEELGRTASMCRSRHARLMKK